MSGLDHVLAAYAAMWRTLGYDRPRWPLPTTPAYDGAYHAEFKDGKYRWIASERGVYLDLMETACEGELLEWIALDLTQTLAKQKFGPQLKMLGKLDPEWAARKKAQLQRDKLI